MSAANNAALKVAKEMGLVKEGRVFDPTIIMAIAPILVELILALQVGCGKRDPETGLAVVNKPNRWARWKVRREVRKTMSWREYRKHGRKMEKGILKAAKKATLKDVTALYDDDGDDDYIL